MKLYHYVHCPFCIRVRMGLNFLNIPYESIVLPYNDEETPIRLTGKKMLPFIVTDSGVAKNESLDILKFYDSKQFLHWSHLNSHFEEINNLIDRIGIPVHSLCMPYWIWTPEFDLASRNYFQQKKEIKRGPFKNLIHQKEKFINELNEILKEDLEKNLHPFYKSDHFSIIDIMIASHLWGMMIFPEYQFSSKTYDYLMSIKKLTHFNYHEDFWK